MNAQEQVVHRRRRRSRAEAGELVAEYEASGLSRLDFCSSHRVSLATLARYRKWHREAGNETLPSKRWVEVARGRPGAVGWADSGLAITLTAGRRIEVGRGFDARTLVELLGVLDRF